LKRFLVSSDCCRYSLFSL